jgi:hypothetical protein
MQPACIRHTELPGTSRLFADFTYHFQRVAKFYRHNPHDPASFALAAREIQYPDSRRAALVAALKAHGVDIVFGMPGVHNLALYDALWNSLMHLKGVPGRHAVVVAVDAATGDVRWRVTTPGWSLRALAVTGDVVTMLTVGGDTEPCRDVLRRLTLGVAEGTTLSLENRSTSAPQYPPSDYTVRDGYLIHLDGATEGWRVALAPLGVSRAGYVVAGSGVVIVGSDGELPLKCHT